MIKIKDNYLYLFNTKIYYGWIIVLIALFCMMYSYSVRYSYSAFFKPMLEEFGWSRTVTSGVFSLYMISYALGSFITGKIVDKHGPKLLIIVGALILGTSVYACSAVKKVYQLYIFYGIFVGLGGAATGWVNATTTISRWFVKKRGLATGIASTGVGIGSSIFIPLATSLIAVYGWKQSYRLYGIVILLTLIPLGFFAVKSPEDMKNIRSNSKSAFKESPSKIHDHNSIEVKQALKIAPYRAMFITQLLLTLQLNAIMVHFIPYATDIGITSLVASKYIALLSLISNIGRIYGGWFSDKMGRKNIIIGSILIQSFSCFFLPFIKLKLFLILFINIYGISYGVWVSQSPPLAADIFGNKYFGSLWGIITVGIGLGGAIGPLLAGLIYDLTGSYFLVFSINIVICLLASFLISFFIKPVKLKSINH